MGGEQDLVDGLQEMVFIEPPTVVHVEAHEGFPQQDLPVGSAETAAEALHRL